MRTAARCALGALLLLNLVIAAPLAAQPLETRAIARVKHTSASRLEAGLPGERFADWFRKVVGPPAKISWELDDCGEQTGTPADVGRDFPACVTVAAALPDGRTVLVSIVVGTFKKGLVGAPVVRLIAIERRGQFTYVPRLQNLPRVIRR
ncbi:MAG: hypothetical protein ACRDIC_09010 [bacterium]